LQATRDSFLIDGLLGGLYSLLIRSPHSCFRAVCAISDSCLTCFLLTLTGKRVYDPLCEGHTENMQHRPSHGGLAVSTPAAQITCRFFPLLWEDQALHSCQSCGLLSSVRPAQSCTLIPQAPVQRIIDCVSQQGPQISASLPPFYAAQETEANRNDQAED
jgi:hypothetical protein